MPISVEDLIPVPRQVETANGTLDLDGLPWQVDESADRDTAVCCKLREELAVNPGVSKSLPANTVAAGEVPTNWPAPLPREQGYVLLVQPSGLVVRGHDVQGLYWGLVTLDQLLAGGRDLPCCEINDWPAFALRGHHDDISRKQVSKLPDFLRIIRLLSRYKINVYTPYMEDMLYLPSHPGVGVGRGRLTPGEVAAMHREASRHNVTIMPTYSLIGHQENLLADPDYAHLGREVFQAMSSLDVRKPEVREFLSDVIRDVCSMFTGPYFHAGFDETQGIGADEFLQHANWCARELKKYGKQMPMWVDMIYNHFGYDMIGELEDNIIPVNWEYGATDRVPHQHELAAQGRPVWGLAGYGNVGAFLPRFAHAKDNIDCWRRDGLETDAPALFSSQWGDNGYENHRDMCWNMFAYLGEAGWSGAEARREDFERRFQVSFYGTELPGLREIIEDLPRRLSIGQREYWAHFRRNAFGMLRWAAENADAAPMLEEEEGLVADAMEKLKAARHSAVLREEHLEHFRVALLRMQSVIHRLQFAMRYEEGLDQEQVREGAAGVQEELLAVREAYKADWLRYNKRPNIGVSLGVYDEVLPTYDELAELEPAEAGRRDGFRTLDLSEHLNRTFLPVGGLPIGERELNGVPFLFADEHHTHACLDDESPEVEVLFPEERVADLHLVIAAHKTGDEAQPAAVVELLSGGEVVFSEELLNIRHLCDWWAPLGEHIWAGGGMAHVDPDRVRYALKPGHMYGLAETHNFDVPPGTRADGVRIRALEGEELRLFAATLELEE